MTTSLSRPTGLLNFLALVAFPQRTGRPTRQRPVSVPSPEHAIGHPAEAGDLTLGIGAEPAVPETFDGDLSKQGPTVFKGWSREACLSQPRRNLRVEQPTWNAPHHWLV